MKTRAFPIGIFPWFFSVFAFYPSLYDNFSLPKLSILLFSLLIVYIIGFIQKPRQKLKPFTREEVLWLFFLLWNILGTLYSHQFYGEMSQFFYFISIFLFYFTLKLFSVEEYIFTILSLVMSSQCIYALCQYFQVGNLDKLFNWVDNAGRLGMVGTLGNCNFLAHMIVLFLPVWIEKSHKGWHFILTIFLSVITLILIFSRTSLAALVLILPLLIIIIQQRKNLKPFLMGLFSLFLLLIIILTLKNESYLKERAKSLFNITKSQNFLQRKFMRMSAYKQLEDYNFKDWLTGKGSGWYKYNYLQSEYSLFSENKLKEFVSSSGSAHYVHFELLQLLIDNGIIGLIIYLGLFLIALQKWMNAILRKNREALSIRTSLLIYFFIGFFSFPLYTQTTIMSFLLLLATHSKVNEKEKSIPPVLWIFIIIILTVLSIIQFRKLQASAYHKLGVAWLKQAIYNQNKNQNEMKICLSNAEKFIQHSIVKYPWDSASLGELGGVFALKKEYSNSEKYLLKSLQYSKNRSLLYNLAVSYYNQKKVQEAIKIYEFLKYADIKSILPSKYLLMIYNYQKNKRNIEKTRNFMKEYDKIE